MDSGVQHMEAPYYNVENARGNMSERGNSFNNS